MKSLPYSCQLCKYVTERKNNFKKHCLTKKHLNNKNEITLQMELEMQMKEEVETKFYPTFSTLNISQCKLCGDQFSRVDSLKRHENKYCKKTTKNKIIGKKYNGNELEFGINNIEISQATTSHENESNESTEVNKLLKEQITQLTKHYNGILAEKERYIDTLKKRTEYISQTHLQIIQNNIITMSPIKFLNTYCANNPTLKDIISSIENGTIDNKYLNTINEAIGLNDHQIVGKMINNILKDNNQELIKTNGNAVGTCENVIFVNDGSGRRFITKGEPGWDYVSDDSQLEEATKTVVNKINTNTGSKTHVPKKDREMITKNIKKHNDWNSHKGNIIGGILGDADAKTHALQIEASVPGIVVLNDDDTIMPNNITEL